MSIIEDERLDEKRNRLELEDNEGDDNISDVTRRALVGNLVTWVFSQRLIRVSIRT